MIEIRVWTREFGNLYAHELRHLRPRRYMCGWSFERMLKYIKEELEWAEIKEEDITSIELLNRREHWFQSIRRA